MTRGQNCHECESSLGHEVQVSLSYSDHTNEEERGLESQFGSSSEHWLFLRASEFNSQHTYDDSQVFVIPVSDDSMPSSVLQAHTWMWFTDM